MASLRTSAAQASRNFLDEPLPVSLTFGRHLPSVSVS